MNKLMVLALLVAWSAAVLSDNEPTSTAVVSATTGDGVRLHGNRVEPGAPLDAPLVLLFHQGMSNGRGEYGFIQQWLAASGYRSIAWDLRSGGSLYGATNRTVAGLEPATAAGYCDAAADMDAAIAHARNIERVDAVVLVGSSYSAALLFAAATANPDFVHGVLAFSPASGGPMQVCRARSHLDGLQAPALVFRPANEMDRASSREQQRIFEAAGIAFRVVENGVHGASMLVDERTGADMSSLRRDVVEWLGRVSGPEVIQ